MKDVVEVVPPLFLAHWESAVGNRWEPADLETSAETEGANERPTATKTNFAAAPKDWQNRRIIAFPVHAEMTEDSAAHWTLAILVNELWNPEDKQQANWKWVPLHFDSAQSNLRNAEKALIYG